MSTIKRFLSYYKPHTGLLILDLSCAFTVAAIDVAYPMLTQYILRTLLPQMAVDSAMVRVFILLLTGALAAYIVRAVLLYCVKSLFEKRESFGAVGKEEKKQDEDAVRDL